MGTLNRTFTVVKKDLYWAVGNIKLVSLMVVPIIFAVLFSNIGGGRLLGFNIAFANAFIGIFFTGLLVIEEKKAGTILALLTTPLRNYEFLIGKFISALLLCLILSVFTLFTHERMDILGDPFSILNLVLFSGTTCFLGVTQGLFFKNEQEMGILSPLFMLLFVMGESINFGSAALIHPFFPDYHIAQFFSSTQAKIPVAHIILHTTFNAIYFAMTLLFATLYARFYFANNLEKRISGRLVVLFAVVISTYFLSGLISPFVVGGEEKGHLSRKEANTGILTIDTDHWVGEVLYKKDEYQLKSIIEEKNARTYNFFPKAKDGKKLEQEIQINIRPLQGGEQDPKLRKKAQFNDRSKVIMGEEKLQISGFEFTKWVYYQNERMYFLFEGICNKHFLQIGASIPKEDLYKSSYYMDSLSLFIKRVRLECHRNRNRG